MASILTSFFARVRSRWSAHFGSQRSASPTRLQVDSAPSAARATADGSDDDKQSYVDMSARVSLVQNRLTAAGLILAALMFSGTFSLSLHGHLETLAMNAISTQSAEQSPTEQIKPDDEPVQEGQGEPNQQSKLNLDDYRAAFAHIELAIALGVCLTLFTIASLLLCQQLSRDAGAFWFMSRRWWFAASTIWLFLSLSQAMSAGVSELVFGLTFRSKIAANVVGIFALPAWLLFLFGAPLHLLLRLHGQLNKSEHRALIMAYVLPIATILGSTTEVYREQSNEVRSLYCYARGLLVQIYQPISWSDTWLTDEEDRCVKQKE